ncbi:DUF257 family protein [Thermococcus thioreducens]|uniref:RecA-superfamily ATPase, KaiC/GvpD/RAD55 family n=1 Tax=Thermococcus thioreducens TaxID=277988 RepID=A0A0Q2S7V9_9EURY|nr:DUF257 family protein [Thermococcus thioreducens]ASJ13270.1 hypothetical protein A3L14_10425 [Thermococcus thioreducens]KQH83315.1 hypothetical protein AMR53_01185 [Thermococcus thioreducens]SEW21851.1 protein of unknown function, DUF257 [Thermococcus thioreducens]
MAYRGIDLILFNILPGETVLVEYSSVSSPEILLYLICRGCTNAGRPVLIDDISDTFAEYVTRLELMGLDTDDLMEIPVIKIGGSREFGNVVGRVEVDKYSLDFKYYGKIYDKVVPEKVVCNPVLGIHKLFVALERQDVIRLVRNISTFVGRKSRFALYFINRDVLEKRTPELLPLLEETASTVLQWEAERGKYRLRAVKAANDEILGSEVSMSFKDIERT